MPSPEFNKSRQQLQQLLEETSQRAGAMSAVAQRESKMSAAKLAQTLILGWAERPEASLNELAQCAERLGVTITGQGIQERINAKTVVFMGALLKASLSLMQQAVHLDIPVLARFKTVRLVDSTQVQLPSAWSEWFRGHRGGLAGVKCHLSYAYLSGCVAAIALVEGRSPDQRCELHVQGVEADSLHLFDLGFFKQEHCASIDEQGGFFICRLQSQTALYQADSGERVDVVAFVRGLATDNTEQQWLLGNRSRLPVRVIFQRLPPAVAQERRRKANLKARQQHKTCTQPYLTLLGWNIFITNVPADWLTASQILTLYRLRWQIELLFKACKSQFSLAAIANWRLERILTQFLARLIGVVLFQWLLAPYRFRDPYELSLAKAVAVIRYHLPALLLSIAARWRSTSHCLADLATSLTRFARKDRRCKSPSTLQLLLTLGA